MTLSSLVGMVAHLQPLTSHCRVSPSDQLQGLGLDLLTQHTFLLMGVLGGALALVVGLLALLLCHCR